MAIRRSSLLAFAFHDLIENDFPFIRDLRKAIVAARGLINEDRVFQLEQQPPLIRLIEGAEEPDTVFIHVAAHDVATKLNQAVFHELQGIGAAGPQYTLPHEDDRVLVETADVGCLLGFRSLSGSHQDRDQNSEHARTNPEVSNSGIHLGFTPGLRASPDREGDRTESRLMGVPSGSPVHD